MSLKKALELLDDRLKRCQEGIEELKSVQNSTIGTVTKDVTKIPLEMLKHEIEDLKEIKKELETD